MEIVPLVIGDEIPFRAQVVVISNPRVNKVTFTHPKAFNAKSLDIYDTHIVTIDISKLPIKELRCRVGVNVVCNADQKLLHKRAPKVLDVPVHYIDGGAKKKDRYMYGNKQIKQNLLASWA